MDVVSTFAMFIIGVILFFPAILIADKTIDYLERLCLIGVSIENAHLPPPLYELFKQNRSRWYIIWLLPFIFGWSLITLGTYEFVSGLVEKWPDDSQWYCSIVIAPLLICSLLIWNQKKDIDRYTVSGLEFQTTTGLKKICVFPLLFLFVLMIAVYIGEWKSAGTVLIGWIMLSFIMSCIFVGTNSQLIQAVSLIHEEFRNANNPQERFREIIERMEKNTRPPRNQVVLILNQFSTWNGAIGTEAKTLLSKFNLTQQDE